MSGAGGGARGARRALVAGGILGLLGVAAGAFGAHGLRNSVTPRELEIWQTAAHYQQIHAVLLVVVGLLGAKQWSAQLRVASLALIAGIVIFATTLQAIVFGGPKWLGAVTPIGGLCLMAGWLALAAHALGRGRSSAADG